MHVLNRIIHRPNRDGAYLYTKHFVSCGCGWQDWFGSEDEGEEAWVDHMAYEVVRDADGSVIASCPR